MLKGRLGINKVSIPYRDRHGLLWLDFGRLEVVSGCLSFVAASGSELEEGRYQIPHQTISMFLLGPGTSITHDALRIICHHGCGVAAIGSGGVRFYTSPPQFSKSSDIARSHAQLWSDPVSRIRVARQMYAMRFGEIVRTQDLDVLRGMEGVRVKVAYRLAAERYGIEWRGRRYDRHNPASADMPNQAINFASSILRSAASIAVSATGAIPQLGFIHEDAGDSFILDMSDLYRQDALLDIAFGTVATLSPGDSLEKKVRNRAAAYLREHDIIPQMIDNIKKFMTLETGAT
ncbi:type I-E CRISPR-associated endonuclease Cas1e [Thalassospira xianhensis]|uniref:CRISPR-associated endonuclease Cas1 n=1 Tax=Thalassospira xianhensis MCCC 1A02616 TaxID=1177929 RepID=A0A367UDD7_9PROT|nr:type I-E CRISPR-associated endonuclease Cas1e [Thalassospira xianhensis]RCK06325.1 CRISPR-associated protein Cas1 [Thalassospira xianhensis MCCC 1A02616]